MKRCVECENDNFEKTKVPHRVRVTSTFKVDVEIPARQCTKCAETYTDGADMERAEFEVARRVADSGVVTGETFRFMRRALGLQSKELAELLGVEPESVTRWEKGDRTMAPLAWLALAMLVVDRANGREDSQKMLKAIHYPTSLQKLFKVAY